MFKKLYSKIDRLISLVESNFKIQQEEHKCTQNVIDTVSRQVSCTPELSRMEKTINSQQRTIEQLTNALKDKYEHGLFIFSENGKFPTVIRDGKEVTNEFTTSFDISWDIGSLPDINISQVAVTSDDMEV